MNLPVEVGHILAWKASGVVKLPDELPDVLVTFFGSFSVWVWWTRVLLKAPIVRIAFGWKSICISFNEISSNVHMYLRLRPLVSLL